MAQIVVKQDSGPSAELQRFQHRLSKCTLCRDLVDSRSRVVGGYGDFSARIMFVGEAPGRLGADITGIPFTKDRSGILLQKMLKMIGLNMGAPESERPLLRDAYITNIVRCNPRGEGNTNRPPTQEEISNCLDYLWTEIEIIKPRLVVTLGVPAARAILGSDFSTDNFGRFLMSDRNFHVLPLWHPAFVIRGGGRQRMNAEKYARFFYLIRDFLHRCNLKE